MISNEIQLWLVPLDTVSAVSVPWLDHTDWLDAAEQSRACRYSHAGARQQYIRARNALRYLLGRFLNQKPEAVRLTISTHGKPRLLDDDEHAGLGFNLSHSGGLGLVGLAPQTELGLDIETLKPRHNLERLAEYCLTPLEQARWRRLPTGQRLGEFTRYWAAKEAFVKATGRGITLGFENVGVDEDFTGFGAIPNGYGSADDWQLHEWGQEGCRMAVAYMGKRRGLVCQGILDEG